MDYICTWIYLDSPEESSEYPQVGKKSHLADFQKVYWKCVAVFFAMSTRFNPQRRHMIFSNKTREEIPQIDGFDLQGFLKSKHVEIVTIPLTWQTPEGYFGKWRNQFYIFDILQFIENQYGSHSDDEPAFIVLDSDCIINRPLDGLFAGIRQHDLLALPMPYSETHNINGVTREGMRQIYAELDGSDPGNNPVYYGGEIFAATLPAIRKINAIAPDVWENMLERFRNGRTKLNEEAHFLSYCYHKIGGFGSLEGFIKRIWTSPHYSNVQPEDTGLPIWHLPSEKTGGIALLFKKLETGNWKLNGLGGYLGVPNRTKYLNLKHYLKYTLLYRWLKKSTG
ncbi:MAG: hypothetical protein KA165_00560 [Saprospiraceae bacterium]|nr:hypothetical protein [Saprospiraceae bacterium]